jgi:hypothetical protein
MLVVSAVIIILARYLSVLACLTWWAKLALAPYRIVLVTEFVV